MQPSRSALRIVAALAYLGGMAGYLYTKTDGAVGSITAGLLVPFVLGIYIARWWALLLAPALILIALPGNNIYYEPDDDIGLLGGVLIYFAPAAAIALTVGVAGAKAAGWIRARHTTRV